MSNLDDINELGLQLHMQILAGDLLASSKIAELFLPLLSRGLHRKYHSLPDSQLAAAAAADAIMQYLANPPKFDPERGKLFSYLWMSAQGDLLNRIKQEKRIENRQVEEKVVEFRPLVAEKYITANQDPEVEMLRSEEAIIVEAKIKTILTAETDLKVVGLMLDGIRDTSAYAEVLSIADRPLEEQSLIVKRNKDRIKIALRRGLRETKEER
jgi:RNA polymerase sigma-70 factor, ECF subfamily